ncbi:MAG: response regulator transcription factor [Ruminococcus sp.]|nr:response regulator transcription factor [Ruminococcus sp.]
MINIEDSSILVVDDDHDIVNAIAALLSREGYTVYKAYNGLEAIDSLMQNDIQLTLIDVMMPKQDGLSAMMKIRATKNIPIIVLSAKSEDSDKILGLSMGADDYITKPYNPIELVALVNSNLRRYLSLGAADSVQKENVVRIGGLVLDRDAKQLSVDGSPVKLTATEYKITELLMTNAGRIFSAEEIYSRVWNEDSYSIENTVMVHIRHIREKIEINPSEPRYLKVVWGIGYKVEKQ